MAAESSRNSGESPRTSWPNAPTLHANPTTTAPAVSIQRIPTVFKFWNTILFLLVVNPGSCCPSVSLQQRHSDESSVFLSYSNCPTVNVFLWCLFCYNWSFVIRKFQTSSICGGCPYAAPCTKATTVTSNTTTKARSILQSSFRFYVGSGSSGSYPRSSTSKKKSCNYLY